jgi:hypothetical protein
VQIPDSGGLKLPNWFCRLETASSTIANRSVWVVVPTGKGIFGDSFFLAFIS